MVLEKDIVGKYVTLRSARVEDSEFTLAIRQDKWVTRYLPYLDITLEQQVAWIKKQREKDDDYFFVLWDKNEERVGTIGIYDIKDGIAEVGRQATIRRSPFEAVEADLLLNQFAFEELGLNEVFGRIFCENKTMLRFLKLGGEVSLKEVVPFHGSLAYKLVTDKEIFYSRRKKILEFLDTIV